jgi:predicted esterase
MRTFVRRFGVALVLLLGGLGATPNSYAQPTGAYRYVAAGPAVFRFEGVGGKMAAAGVDRDTGILSDWRVLPDMPVDAATGEYAGTVRCSRGRSYLCFLGVGIGNRDRVAWRAVDVRSGQRLTDWADAGFVNFAIVDFDDRLGAALLVARPTADRQATDLEPGLYLWRKGQPLSKALRLTDKPALGWMRHASFVGDHPDRARVFAVEAGPPATWTLFDLKGRRLGATAAPGAFSFRAGSTIYAVSNQASTDGKAPIGSLLAVRMPDGGEAPWPIQLAYRPPTGHRLVMDDDSQDVMEVNRPAALTWSGSVVAVEASPRGRGLVELCRGPDEMLRARPLAADPYADAVGGRTSLRGGGDESAAVAVLRRRVDGGTDTGLLAGARRNVGGGALGAACNDPALARVDMPEGAVAGIAPRDAPIEERSLTLRDGRRLTYAVLGQPGGQVLLRVYGAMGADNPRMATGAFESQWLSRGNRIVVADVSRRRGDYKAEAAADTLAIAHDLVRRSEARRGELVVAGTSAGANLAARAALAEPDLFAAALLFSGAYDLELLAASGVTNAADFGAASGGFATWYGGRQSRGEPIRFLLVHGQDDDRVSGEHPGRMAAYLKSLGYQGKISITQTGGHAAGQTTTAADEAFRFLADLPDR